MSVVAEPSESIPDVTKLKRRIAELEDQNRELCRVGAQATQFVAAWANDHASGEDSKPHAIGVRMLGLLNSVIERSTAQKHHFTEGGE